MYTALYGSDPMIAKIGEALNAFGTVCHHAAASLYVCLWLTGVVPPASYVVDPALVLLVQHWFVLLIYVNQMAYIIIELLVEVWFEWVMFSVFEELVYTHVLLGVAAGTMLVAHWLYLLSAFLELLPTDRCSCGHAKNNDEDNVKA